MFIIEIDSKLYVEFVLLTINNLKNFKTNSLTKKKKKKKLAKIFYILKVRSKQRIRNGKS